jgi:hypothetical protein
MQKHRTDYRYLQEWNDIIEYALGTGCRIQIRLQRLHWNGGNGARQGRWTIRMNGGAVHHQEKLKNVSKCTILQFQRNSIWIFTCYFMTALIEIKKYM